MGNGRIWPGHAARDGKRLGFGLAGLSAAAVSAQGGGINSAPRGHAVRCCSHLKQFIAETGKLFAPLSGN
jgi:hypothetical protein